MLGFDRQVIILADRLFPSQIETDYREYRLAMSRFLKEIKRIHPQERNTAFFENYYSRDNIAWFMLKGTRYFTILHQAGTAIEDRYYGKQIVFFNP